MSLLNISDTNYVVSLDGLDLSLLSQFVNKRRDDRTLLWSKPVMDGETAYCQVKIGADKFEHEDSYIESTDTYTCHICNIDIPKMYYKLHIKSKMHHNHRILTEKVLENLAKQIYVDIDSTGVIENINQYYCEACCKVVPVKNTEKHNNSKYHLKSVENQKLSDNFIEIYINKEVERLNSDVKVECNNNDVQNKDNKVNSIDTEYFPDDDESDQSIQNDKTVNNTCAFNTGIAINNVYRNSPELSNLYEPSLSDESEEYDSAITPLDTKKEIENFQLYLKEMMKIHKLQFKMPLVEDNAIVIVTPKGFKEKITIEEFHGFTKSGRLSYCQLCKMWMYDHSKLDHIRTEQHVKNIVQPVNDNYIRDVLLNDKWSHCLICNIMVIKGSNHAALKHKNHETTPKTTEVPKTSDTTVKQTFCNICNKYIDSHNFLSHTKSNKHKKNVKLNTDKSVPVAVTNNSLPAKDTVKKATQTFCDVCKRYIDTHNFPSHTKSIKHKDNLKNKIDVPSVTPSKVAVQNYELYCEVCKVKVPKTGMDIHNRGKPHLKNSAKLDKQNKSEINLTTNTTNLPSTSKIVAVNKTVGNIALKERIQALNNKKIMIRENLSESWECQVCDVKVNEHNVIEHVESFDHEMLTNKLLDVSKIRKRLNDVHYCDICDRFIGNYIEHIKENVGHMLKFVAENNIQINEYVHLRPSNSERIAIAYRIIYKAMLKRHKITTINNSSFYFCNCCNYVIYGDGNEIDHMISERHVNSVKKII